MTLKDLSSRLRLDRDVAGQVVCDIFGVEDLSADLPEVAIRGLLVLEFLAIMQIGRSTAVQMAIVRASSAEIQNRTTIRLVNNRFVAQATGGYYDTHERTHVDVLPPVPLRSMLDVEVMTAERMKNVLESPHRLPDPGPVCHDTPGGDA